MCLHWSVGTSNHDDRLSRLVVLLSNIPRSSCIFERYGESQMPLREDAASLGEHMTQAAERLIRLHMIMGLPEKALPILLSLAEADSVTSILDSLIERVHVAAGTG